MVNNSKYTKKTLKKKEKLAIHLHDVCVRIIWLYSDLSDDKESQSKTGCCYFSWITFNNSVGNNLDDVTDSVFISYLLIL